MPTVVSKQRILKFGRHASAAGMLMVVALFLLLLLPSVLPAQESPKTYQTKYATISYTEDKDLHTFTRNTGSGFSFLRESSEQNPLLAKTQVDKMVETIFSLLDMVPPNFHFGINIYRTQGEVTAAFYRVSGRGAAPVAFYAHQTRSIAIAVDSITDGILVHEIAHAVISAYFPVPPPARMQEILAQHMDKNIRDN